MNDFKFEKILNYPLAGATGYDVDETLIAIRAIEQNKEWVAENCSPQFVHESWDEFYREKCCTQLKKENIKMNYIGDAILLATLHY